MRFLVCLAKAVVKNGLNLLLDGLPFGNAICDIAKDTWGSYRQPGAPEAQTVADLQTLAQAPAAQLRQQADAAAREAAPEQPPQVQKALAAYLTQVPAMIRRVSRRPSDPRGLTVPAGLMPRKAEDLQRLLPSRPPRFKPGDRPLPGVDWVLEELLGIGGFGEVWKARHADYPDLERALKFCLDKKAADTLRNEAEKLTRVMKAGHHDGIVPLRQIYLKNDPPCLEYDCVAGGDLGGLIQQLHEQKQATPDYMARWMLHLAATVRFAHGLTPPLVHRDLKPANILVQRGKDGKLSLRVADFGISEVAAAQVLGGSTHPEEVKTVVHGAYTALYASPQQMAGLPADPRDDIHALGVIWYQMLTGDLTRGRPSGSSWKRQLGAQGVAAGQIDLLEACMDDDAGTRPADAGVFHQQLHALLQPRAVTVAEKPREQPRPAAQPPAGLPREIVNSIDMKLVLVGPGKFLMGSPEDEAERNDGEGPQHEVEITRPFYIGIYAGTQEEYQRVMGVNPSYFSSSGRGKDNVRGMDTRRLPVENVSWKDAIEFCRRLSEMPNEKRSGRVYHLPTEAEWEYSCRGGATSLKPFHFGDSLSPREANFNGAVGRPTPVGSYPANAFGLFDMHGNVWEWCADWYGPYTHKSVKDPTGASTGERRVLRGGSWGDVGRVCRAAYRVRSDPGDRFNLYGFRVVCVAAPRTS